MTKEATTQSPRAVAKTLDISPASLRRWSDEFTDFLSEGAGSKKGRSHRRYTDEDVERLTEIKELMNSGMTYEQVRQQLGNQVVFSNDKEAMSPDLKSMSVPVQAANESSPPADVVDSATSVAEVITTDDGIADEPITVEAAGDSVSGQAISGDVLNEDSVATDSFINEVVFDDDDNASDKNQSLSVVTDNGSEGAVAFLTNTLSSLSDSHKSILNSQAANRELMGVLLQDNFNLKEENNRLRERVLDVERQLMQGRQEDEWRLDALRKEMDAKIATINQVAAEAVNTARSVEMPEIKAVETKPGCLGMILGRGGTQIITTRPRKSQGQASQTPPTPQFGPDQGVGPAQPSHPKPMFPPE